jgi:hypothetical protein
MKLQPMYVPTPCNLCVIRTLDHVLHENLAHYTSIVLFSAINFPQT